MLYAVIAFIPMNIENILCTVYLSSLLFPLVSRPAVVTNKTFNIADSLVAAFACYSRNF